MTSNTTSLPLVLEGTWEEILTVSAQLAGRRVRVVVLEKEESPENQSTASSLLKYAGTWEGDDLQECLDMVYDTRGQIGA
jgi:D-alanyl-D-alanine carboxypeptidase